MQVESEIEKKHKFTFLKFSSKKLTIFCNFKVKYCRALFVITIVFIECRHGCFSCDTRISNRKVKVDGT